MKKIASFSVNHDKLKKGMYVSRIDGDVVTYDLRMKVPNAGDYLSNGALHTFEHLFATYARNSALSDSVIYVGPMGCRTGFYFLLRDNVSPPRCPASRARNPSRSSAILRARFPAAAAKSAATTKSTTSRAPKRLPSICSRSSRTGRRRKWNTKCKSS